jgi:hypothetical protein
MLGSRLACGAGSSESAMHDLLSNLHLPPGALIANEINREVKIQYTHVRKDDSMTQVISRSSLVESPDLPTKPLSFNSEADSQWNIHQCLACQVPPLMLCGPRRTRSSVASKEIWTP